MPQQDPYGFEPLDHALLEAEVAPAAQAGFAATLPSFHWLSDYARNSAGISITAQQMGCRMSHLLQFPCRCDVGTDLWDCTLRLAVLTRTTICIESIAKTFGGNWSGRTDFGSA